MTLTAADGNCSRQPSRSDLMLSGAVYLANLHHSAADANPQILLDEQVTDSMRAGANLILFGSPKDNKVVRHYQQQVSSSSPPVLLVSSAPLLFPRLLIILFPGPPSCSLWSHGRSRKSSGGS